LQRCATYSRIRDDRDRCGGTPRHHRRPSGSLASAGPTHRSTLHPSTWSSSTAPATRSTRAASGFRFAWAIGVHTGPSTACGPREPPYLPGLSLELPDPRGAGEAPIRAPGSRSRTHSPSDDREEAGASRDRAATAAPYPHQRSPTPPTLTDAHHQGIAHAERPDAGSHKTVRPLPPPEDRPRSKLPAAAGRQRSGGDHADGLRESVGRDGKRRRRARGV